MSKKKIKPLWSWNDLLCSLNKITDLSRDGHPIENVPQDDAHHHFVSQVEDDSFAVVVFVRHSRSGCSGGHGNRCHGLRFTFWADASSCNAIVKTFGNVVGVWMKSCDTVRNTISIFYYCSYLTSRWQLLVYPWLWLWQRPPLWANCCPQSRWPRIRRQDPGRSCCAILGHKDFTVAKRLPIWIPQSINQSNDREIQTSNVRHSYAGCIQIN